MKNRFDKSEIADELAMFKAGIGYPTINSNPVLENLFNELQKQEFLKRLGPQEIAEYIIMLNSYALYITTQENSLKAQYNWCESNIKHVVGRELSNADGYGFNEKDTAIRSKNETASKLENSKLMIKAKMDLLSNISLKIQYMVDGLRNFAIEKNRSIK